MDDIEPLFQSCIKLQKEWILKLKTNDQVFASQMELGFGEQR